MLSEEKGFTLIELIIVVAITAILGAVVTPNILKVIDNSRVVAAVTDANSIKSAAVAYNADTGRWPVSPKEVKDDTGGDPDFVKGPEENGAGIEGWNGPYLDRWSGKNPWGGTYTLFLNDNKLYLQLNDVPASALEKLQDKLGKTIVIKDQDGNGENNVDINISIYLAE